MTEKTLIAGIRRRALRSQNVALGIGDDCAILRIPRGHEVLVTTDFSLEGVHFRRDWHPPEVVGRRCLVRGLSDIAAMGGEPLAAFLSLALPRTMRKNWADRFLTGLLKLAREFDITLAGGDTAESGGKILADIVVTGSVPKGTAIRRDGARPDDRIFVTGTLGGSAATLSLLYSGRKLRSKDFLEHFHPTPRVEVGRVLREQKLVSSMIDISDGLSTDLMHICEESHVGAKIDASLIPRSKIGRPGREVDLKFALHGGDDYELLFTAPRRKQVPEQIAGVPITQIGTITDNRNMLIMSRRKAQPLRAKGWQHFGKTIDG
jgi:thiamine-monophosphate kinase